MTKGDLQSKLKIALFYFLLLLGLSEIVSSCVDFKREKIKGYNSAGTGYKVSSLGKKVSLYMNYGFIVINLIKKKCWVVVAVVSCRASVGVNFFDFRRFERPCKSELFEITSYLVQFAFSFSSQLATFWPLFLAIFWPFFGPEL